MIEPLIINRTICIWTIVFLTVAVSAADWPQFLGPNRNGVYTGNAIAETWPASGLPQLWERPVGEGYSNPVVFNGRLILFHREGEKDVVEALDAETGEVYASGSAGHNADDSEWVVLDQNTWDYLGSHPHESEDECIMGDVNGDGSVDVLDIVQIVGFIVDGGEPDFDLACADSNGDGLVDVLDLVQIVGIIIGERNSDDDATQAKLIKEDGVLFLNANGYIGGVQMTLSHTLNISSVL